MRKGPPRWSAQFCSEMVRPTGFEPVTPRLGIWCSILLSYGRLARNLAFHVHQSGSYVKHVIQKYTFFLHRGHYGESHSGRGRPSWS